MSTEIEETANEVFGTLACSATYRAERDEDSMPRSIDELRMTASLLSRPSDTNRTYTAQVASTSTLRLLGS
jgi:hypothetical protein